MSKELSPQVPLDELDLPIRTYNILTKQKISTLQDLLDCSDDDLLSLRNFGPKMLQEVKLCIDYFLKERDKEPQSPIKYQELDFFCSPYHWSRRTRLYVNEIQGEKDYIRVYSTDPAIIFIPCWHCWMYINQKHTRFSAPTLQALAEKGRNEQNIDLERYTYSTGL